MKSLKRFAPAILGLSLAFSPAAFVWAQETAPAEQKANLQFKPFSGATPAAKVYADQLENQVVVEGTINKVDASTGPRVPHRLLLVDRPSQPVMVVYWPDVAPKIHGDQPVPRPGARLSAKGTLTEYRGALQIKVRDASQIRIEGYPLTLASRGRAQGDQSVPVPGEKGYFTIEDVPGIRTFIGHDLSFRGEVTGFRESWSDTAPNVITIAKDDSDIEIVYWLPDGAKGPDFEHPGTPVYVTGELQDYNGRLQIRVTNMAELSRQPLKPGQIARPKLITEQPESVKEGWPGKTDAPSVKIEKVELEEGARVSLRDLGPQHVGNLVTVSGQITAMQLLENGHVAATLKEPTGFARLLIPQDWSKERPQIGQDVTMKAKVSYNETRSAVDLVLKEIVSR